MRRAAEIRLDGERVDLLPEEEKGYSFLHDGQWLAAPDAQAISLTMPLRSEPYTSRRPA